MILSTTDRRLGQVSTAEFSVHFSDEDADVLSMMAVWVNNRIAYHTELLNKKDKPIHYDNLLYHRHCIELLQDMKGLFFASGKSDDIAAGK